jgi:uncharacterized membrane protein YjfL (UPF0719 family)
MKMFMLAFAMMLLGSGQVLADDASPTMPSHFWSDMACAFAFGLVVILLMVIGYKFIDWAMKGVDFDVELTKGNTSVGIVVAAIFIGIAYAVSNVVVAIIH